MQNSSALTILNLVNHHHLIWSLCNWQNQDVSYFTTMSSQLVLLRLLNSDLRICQNNVMDFITHIGATKQTVRDHSISCSNLSSDSLTRTCPEAGPGPHLCRWTSWRYASSWSRYPPRREASSQVSMRFVQMAVTTLSRKNPSQKLSSMSLENIYRTAYKPSVWTKCH